MATLTNTTAATSSIEQRLAEHPFLEGLNQPQIALLAKAAIPTEFQPNELIFSRGEPANGFYLIESGSIALESPQPNAAPVVIETIHAGEPLGWSWLFPPYRWQFSARAVERGTAVCIAGIALREHRDEDLTLSHELFKRMSRVMVHRLQTAREKLASAHQR